MRVLFTTYYIGSKVKVVTTHFLKLFLKVGLIAYIQKLCFDREKASFPPKSSERVAHNCWFQEIYKVKSVVVRDLMIRYWRCKGPKTDEHNIWLFFWERKTKKWNSDFGEILVRRVFVYLSNNPLEFWIADTKPASTFRNTFMKCGV